MPGSDSGGRATLLREARKRLGTSLESTLSSTIVPYGYTVTLWVSGAYLLHRHGAADRGVGVVDGVAFAAGALFAFGLLAALSGSLPSGKSGAPGSLAAQAEARHPVFAAGVHVVAVGLALTCSMLGSRWFGDAAWFLAPFLATAVYLAVASAELAIALELSERESRFAYGVRLRRRRGVE